VVNGVGDIGHFLSVREMGDAGRQLIEKEHHFLPRAVLLPGRGDGSIAGCWRSLKIDQFLGVVRVEN
jgi:hypothetical protein